MNFILFVADTFRADNLTGPVHTPHLDAFAQTACRFPNAYLGSFPTVPHRRDVMSGRFACTESQWGPLPHDLVVLQQVLSRVGILTAMVADTPHLMGNGFNYGRGFDGFLWIRGQENDHYRTRPRHVPQPPHPEKWRPDFEESLLRYTRNVAERQREEDWFAPQTVLAANRWLEENAHEGPFFLYVDCFDPHEPWDPPARYLKMYGPGYSGLEVTYPACGFWREFLTPQEMAHCRALYAGEVTLLDHWFGRLLVKVESLGVADDTAILFTSDHGFLFGEHDFLGKSHSSAHGFETAPLYQPISHIPLLIRLSGQQEGRCIPALAQPPDLMPTILELAGVVTTETVSGQAAMQVLQCGIYGHHAWRLDPAMLHGHSLAPLLRGEAQRVRDLAVSSHTLVHPTPTVAKARIVCQPHPHPLLPGGQGRPPHPAHPLPALRRPRREPRPAGEQSASGPGDPPRLRGVLGGSGHPRSVPGRAAQPGALTPPQEVGPCCMCWCLWQG
ncbi:MAG: sulfatase [Chloroflexi bacterium]|nr:sulfatase [Chloroflexota bacterium]